MWDVLFGCLVLAAGWAGYRRGALSALSTVVGVACGLVLDGPVSEVLFPPSTLREVVVNCCIGIVVVTLVATTVLSIGAHVLKRHLPDGFQTVDAVVGAMVRGLVVTIAVGTLWTVISNIPVALLPSAVRGVRDGAPVTAWVSRNTPIALIAGRAPSLVPIPALQTPLRAPDATVSATPSVRRAAESVVRIEAAGCPGRIDTGSGWVMPDDRVLTAAHVVAGATSVTVQWGARERQARVVGIDVERDMAVLSVRTGLRPLPARSDARTSSFGAVLGYPRGGPLQRRPARIGSTNRLWIPNLIGGGVTKRSVLSLRARVEPGNSGGPIVDEQGVVIGLVFASGAADAGYALPADDFDPLPVDPNVGVCLPNTPNIDVS